MKIKHLIFAIQCGTLVFIKPTTSFALGVIENPVTPGDTSITCTVETCPSDTSSYIPLLVHDISWCSSIDNACFSGSDGNNYILTSCSSCFSPYSLTMRSEPKCKYVVQVCSCACDDCNNLGWQSHTTGYQKNIHRACDCSTGTATCEQTYVEYRCAAGYWGSSSDGTSGCSSCPPWNGVFTDAARTTVAGGTSAAGATDMTGCYVNPGTYYDATGTFEIASSCPYKN